MGVRLRSEIIPVCVTIQNKSNTTERRRLAEVPESQTPSGRERIDGVL